MEIFRTTESSIWDIALALSVDNISLRVFPVIGSCDLGGA